MPVYRVDVLTHEPDRVRGWIWAHVPEGFLVRGMGYSTVDGWYFKCVFKRQSDAEAFHRRWYPDAKDHSVPPWE